MEWWRIMHLLTGRDYVHLENRVDEIIRRVRYTHNGEPYCVYLGSMLIFLDKKEHGWTVTKLT